MQILITGGAGFIGTSLSLELVKKGHQVTILDNFSPQIHGNNHKNTFLYKRIENLVTIVEGDIRNKDLLNKLIKSNEAIVHLAAETGTGQSMYQIHKYTDVNINGSALLLDILANDNHHIKKLVIASSRAIYGEGAYICSEHGRVYPEPRKEEDLVMGNFANRCPTCNKIVDLSATKENDKVNASSIYGLTKYNQEQMFIIMGKALNIPTIALRYQNVYGPGQSLKNPYTGILSIFSTRIKNGNDINIFEDGKESRDFVYIDDVVQATSLAIENTTIINDIFNVGSGVATTVEEVAKTLLENYNSNNKYTISGAYRIGDIRHNVADLSKIRSVLGYSPKYSFKEGINKFVSWVNAQEIQQDNYDKSIEEMKNKGLYK
ncbi:NAD-dependent epimerase/dehydratase family protein [Emticicia agri]|uniref:NAD-dependent epimerase/dehydratase family protein n=1 Tax=Emticicia agri TaxID=2492393 RepID=A0A4Q5LX84_9BACT|nr:NAD-dependent epimerase/dehydratase family protein [Emticicia agri]RYU94352.1 NAD-dependent epimerase/dehydratase family protein [Emticicia agri]